jgi:electron transport complex protein RnfG
MRNYVGQGWLVVVLAFVFGAALAGINTALSPIIAENQRNETYGEIPNLVPGADGEKTRESAQFKGAYEARDKDDKQIGWVIRAKGMGYGGTIKALVGLNPDASKITGIYILEQIETPGFGNKITTTWNRQYIDQPTARPLKVYKGMSEEEMKIKDGRIDAISGATISSNALTNLVNKAVEAFRGELAETEKGKTNKAKDK